MASRLPSDSSTRPSTVLGVVHQLRTAAGASAPSPARAPSPLCGGGGGSGARARAPPHALRDAYAEIDRLDSLIFAAEERAAVAAAGRARVCRGDIMSPRPQSGPMNATSSAGNSSPLIPSGANAFIPTADDVLRLKAIEAKLAEGSSTAVAVVESVTRPPPAAVDLDNDDLI